MVPEPTSATFDDHAAPRPRLLETIPDNAPATEHDFTILLLDLAQLKEVSVALGR
jgi:hypothetical protein